MSLRLRFLNLGLRLFGRPRLARTVDPVLARRNFLRVSRLLWVPRHARHRIEPGPVPLHWVSLRPRRSDWLILYLHGGAYATGSPVTHRALMARIAGLTGLPVVAPQYRLAPEHPAPAAFEDALAAHAALLERGHAAAQIILAGDSAGGGLALAVLARLCSGGQRPAGIVAFSPWTDLTLTGESLVGNAAREALLPPERMGMVVDLARGGLHPADPRLSPLFARFDNPPPALLQVGTTEILRDDSRRMAAHLRAAGGAVRLSEWEDCPHVWQMLGGYLPEAEAALAEVAAFVRRLIPGSAS